MKRFQGRYFLKEGDEASALERFQSVKDLEEKYDVQLLTDADRRRLNGLEGKA